tara:strand:+ start:20351 stop:21622 length:1272 start_codon:yes stop_codon:yes gene_type:complete
MYLNSYLNLKNKEIYLLFYLFIFSFLIRIPSIFVFGDTNLENEWKLLVSYLEEYGHLYSILPRLVDATMSYSSLPTLNLNDLLVPNVFMPPLYAYYLYFFKFFNFNNELYILVILFSQSLLSSISVVVFYHINKIFFSTKLSIISTLIFSLFPIHVYSCGQISSAILQTFLIVLFFYFFFKIIKKNNFFNIFFLSISSGLLILLRGEFIAFFLLSILYLGLFLKVNLKNIIIIIFLTAFVISPYLARNIIVLDTITITKSIGYNLWKGNNPGSNVEGNSRFDENIREEIKKVSKDNYYDVNVDKILLKHGLKSIKEDPVKYFILYIKKFLSFIFIDINSTYFNYYHPLHYLPILFIGMTSVLGIILYDRNSLLMNYLILYFMTNIAIISIFFILPRYSLPILPVQIIFSNIFFRYIGNKFFKT